jgi:hypothetical protein
MQQIGIEIPLWQGGPTPNEYNKLAQKNGGWISVDDLDPPKGRKVVTFGEKGFDYDEYMPAPYNRFFQDWESEKTVTHWQMLFAPCCIT